MRSRAGFRLAVDLLIELRPHRFTMVLGCSSRGRVGHALQSLGAVVAVFSLVAIAGLVGLGLSGRASAGLHEDANSGDRRGDYQTEYRILAPEAARGQAWAQNNLGNMFLFGRGVVADDAEAVASFEKAAAQGDPGGQINLGQMYEDGLGVPTDTARAASLYRTAGEHGRAGGWAMLKRLCDHRTNIAATECARIPPCTQSAPGIQLSGRPGAWLRAFLALVAVILGTAVLVQKFRVLVKKMKDPTGPSVATVDGDDVTAAQVSSPAFLRFLIFGSGVVTLLALAPLMVVVFRNPAETPWSPFMVMWIVGLLLTWFVAVSVRARRLRRSR